MIARVATAHTPFYLFRDIRNTRLSPHTVLGLKKCCSQTCSLTRNRRFPRCPHLPRFTRNPVPWLAPSPSPSPHLHPSLLLSPTRYHQARYRDDEKMNHNAAERMDTGALGSKGAHIEAVRWKDIRVGDTVVIREGGQFPADVVVLTSAKDDGTLFVETASLDGETNLKLRTAIVDIHAMCTPSTDCLTPDGGEGGGGGGGDAKGGDDAPVVGGESLEVVRKKAITKGSILGGITGSIEHECPNKNLCTDG